jgi:hypothetical protein
VSDDEAKFQPRYGTHVVGAEFWSGAKPDPDELVARLKNRTSIALFGLRRIGKSSLVAECRDRLRAQGKKVLWIDLQKHDGLAGTLAAILKELSETETLVDTLTSWVDKTNIIPESIKARLKSIVNKQLDMLADNDVDEYAEALFEQLGTQLAGMKDAEKPIIIFDELPLLILNSIQRAPEAEHGRVVARFNKFLAILRHWRSRDVGVTMAICGSFSMAWLRRRHGIVDEHLNDCEPVSVEEMEQKDALGLIEACAKVSKPKKWSAESAATLLELLPALYPGVIQLAHNTIRYASDTSPKALNGKLRSKIEAALEQKYYSQFDARFSRYEREERERAAKLFKALAQAKGKAVPFEDAIRLLTVDPGVDDQDGRDLLDLMQSDGFVIATRRLGVTYSSGLAAAWRQDA